LQDRQSHGDNARSYSRRKLAIGAFSFVNNDISANVIAFGVPAKVAGTLGGKRKR